ncbi:membrane protein [Aureobasidium sp. EXF-8845]|nr:membrane protein [Aureobasidium sp. EXF-8845]KAI4856171.1 membrane protein [Aureobasidium sp. EXF-8846]
MSTDTPSVNVSREATWKAQGFHASSRKPQPHHLEMEDYFAGPRDMARHSKLPFFMRLHGSVLPKMILPLLFIGGWATMITLISKFVFKLGINSLLLTVLGFVVGLALSFRSSTAHERYNDGRKYWSQLMLTSRNMARLIWVHVEERHDESEELGKRDLLDKLSALNLVNAFAVALKHRLRFEPAVEYPDLEPLVAHLNLMAGTADQVALRKGKTTPWKAAGEYLGVSFAESNPRKLIKRANDNLGNPPLEILTYLSSYMEHVMQEKLMPGPIHQTWSMNNIGSLADVLTGTERVLNTPLPIAYTISISQITWAYVLVLPFQLYNYLDWVTIPGTMLAAYIILGLSKIGTEIENPFGNDVNDLPLDDYCRELAADIDVMTSIPAPRVEDWARAPNNRVLHPLSATGYAGWENRSIEDIREALRAKATTSVKSINAERSDNPFSEPKISTV